MLTRAVLFCGLRMQRDNRRRSGARWAVAILALAVLAEVGIWFHGRSQAPDYVTQKVTRGDLTVTVSRPPRPTLNSQSSVDVGVEVSGRVGQGAGGFQRSVKADQVIAIINTDQTRAQLQQSEATLATNQATLIQNKQKLDRYLGLQKMGAVALQGIFRPHKATMTAPGLRSARPRRRSTSSRH